MTQDRKSGWAAALAAIAAAALGSTVRIAAADPALDPLRLLDKMKLNEIRMEGSHNSYRKFPSPAEEAKIRAVAPEAWPKLDYGHPPLESRLALGLHQFEIDVSPDPEGGLYAAPYADATPEIRKMMAAPGAKVLHIPGLDTETHCLTFHTCLAVFARWSDAHPHHDPMVILVNSVDPELIPGVWSREARFDQASIDALNQEITEVIGRSRVIAPDDVRGSHATLREAAFAKAWPELRTVRGKFLFVLDGSDAHETYLRTGHPSLRGRMMFGWFDAMAPEAAFFNIQDPVKDFDLIRRLVKQGFIVRTRADADVVEARKHDASRMKAALSSGAQLVSTDFYPGVPDPEGFLYSADFAGPMLRCDEVTATCGPGAR